MVALLFGALKAVGVLLWFLFTLGVLVHIWRDDTTETLGKFLWTAAIFIMPFLGPILWIVFGRNRQAMG